MPAKSSSSAPDEDFTARVQAFITALICWPMATSDTMQTLGSHGWLPSCFTEEQLAFMREKKDTPEAQWVPAGKSDNCRWKINNNDVELRKAVNAHFRDGHDGRKFTPIEINGRLNLMKSEGKTMALPVDSSKPLEDRVVTMPFVDAGAGAARKKGGLLPAPDKRTDLEKSLDKMQAIIPIRDSVDKVEGVDSSEWDDGTVNTLKGEKPLPADADPDLVRRLSSRRMGIAEPSKDDDEDNASAKNNEPPKKTDRPKLDPALLAKVGSVLCPGSSTTVAPVKSTTTVVAAPAPVAASRPPLPPLPPAGLSLLPPPSTGSPPPPPPPPLGAPSAAPSAAPVSEPVAARVTRSASKTSAAQESVAAQPPLSWAGRVWSSTVGLVVGAGGHKTLENQDASGSTSPGSSVVRESSGIAPSAASHTAWGEESGPVLNETVMEHNLRQIIQDQGDKMKVLKERVAHLQAEKEELVKDICQKSDRISNLELENGALKVGNNNAAQIRDLLQEAQLWEKRYNEADGERQRQMQELGEAKSKYWLDTQAKDNEIANLKAQLASSSPVSQAKFNQMETELRQAKRELEDSKRVPPSSTTTGNELQLMIDLQNTRTEVDNLTRELQASKAKVAALEQARSMPPPPPLASTTLPSQGGVELQKKLDVALKERDDAMTLVRAQMDANRKLTNEIANLKSSAGNAPQSTLEIQRLKTEIVDLKRQASLAYSSAPTRAFTVSSAQSAPSRSVTTSSFVSASSSISSSMSESETARKLARMEEKYNDLKKLYENVLRDTGRRTGQTPSEDVARYEAYLAAKAARSARR